MKKRLAIIGTGISGMVCGHFLHEDYDIVLYEKNDYVGGHTHTMTLSHRANELAFDTGFMVYNEVTYPLLTRLFYELNVTTVPTSMSFSVQHVPSGIEFSGSGWNGLFAQRLNLVRPRFLRLLREIDRFNRESVTILKDPTYDEWTVGRFMESKSFHRDLLDLYLLPMSSAVWSTPAQHMLTFPITTLVRFFFNHGFLGLYTQHPWRTVKGGSVAYRDKLIKPFKDRIRVGSKATSVRRTQGEAIVTDSTGHRETYDLLILATHADQALSLLSDPTPQEKALLAPFKYQTNSITIHQDASVMPKEKRAWSSWNSRVSQDAAGQWRSSTIYDMNSLQGVSDTEHVFISIDDPGWVNPKSVLKTLIYEHPLYSGDAIRAQKALPSLNESGPTYFCGSYFGYGFHEDALASSVSVARQLARSFPWN